MKCIKCKAIQSLKPGQVVAVAEMGKATVVSTEINHDNDFCFSRVRVRTNDTEYEGRWFFPLLSPIGQIIATAPTDQNLTGVKEVQRELQLLGLPPEQAPRQEQYRSWNHWYSAVRRLVETQKNKMMDTFFQIWQN